MIRLADTSFRLYRKKDGTVSVRLNSYIIINAKGHGFRLSAYLNQFDCTLTLASGQIIQLDDYSYTEACLHRMDHMVYKLWLSGVTEMEKIEDTVGQLHIEYRIFSCHGQGSPDIIDCVVPVLARGKFLTRRLFK